MLRTTIQPKLHDLAPFNQHFLGDDHYRQLAFIVMPHHRLILCHIDKVGGTQFRRLFFELDNVERVVLGQHRLFLANDRSFLFKHASLQWHRISNKRLQRFLVDPAWHKAVFWREPLERFLAAYDSKCGGRDRDGELHCENAFGNPRTTLAEAVRALAASNVTNHNTHFLAQSAQCGGLWNYLEHYQTVEPLRRETSHDRVKALLARVGYDLDPANHVGAQVLKILESHFPKSGVSIEGKHATLASERVARAFNRSDAQELVRYYAKDYLLFGIPLPEWARSHFRDMLPALQRRRRRRRLRRETR
jgi:hypothetical protein